MEAKELLDATCRVALAAYQPGIDTFAERAGILVDVRTDTGGGSPAWNLVASMTPEKEHDALWPAGGGGGSAHRSAELLQRIVAMADRVAVGIATEASTAPRLAKGDTPPALIADNARLAPLLEQLRLGTRITQSGQEPRYRYQVAPSSPESLFPAEIASHESAGIEPAHRAYRRLWEGFASALESIPHSHRANWPMWLDHFDSAWACYAQAIPVSTVDTQLHDVSFADHARTTAALAAALWRYHHDNGDDEQSLLDRFGADASTDWSEEKLLLVQGDFFGIQEFIFATGGETQRRAAKLLRGRSFYVSLLTECAALRILDRLSLPPTSQVISAAGKFLIAAPNTASARSALAAIQTELDAWFLEHSYGQSGIGLAWLPARCDDFLSDSSGEEPPFRGLIRRLFEQLQTAKTRRFDLCGERPPAPVFADFLARFDAEKGVCAIDGRSPATERLGETDRHVCALAADQIAVGTHLAYEERLYVTDQPVGAKALKLSLFGYHVLFANGQAKGRDLDHVAPNAGLRRAWDFALPTSGSEPLFRGYARRYINGYVPLFGEMSSWEADRYSGLPADLVFERHPQEPKTLEHLACDDRWADANGRYQGVEALVTIKGDVDDLGTLFETGLSRPGFTRMVALSRQMNAFFSVWLPWLCRNKYPNTYTVFAGGDDFFLIAPWRSAILLAQEMRSDFRRFVAGNADLHFCTGLSMTRPGLPIRQMGELAERALEHAKDRRDAAGRLVKDAVTCFGHTVGWEDFDALLRVQGQLEADRAELGLSTGYLYGLQYLADMAEDLRRAQMVRGHSPRVDSALWNSRFTYQTRRMLEAKRRMTESERQHWQQRLGLLIGDGIRQHGAAFKIALFTHLYHHRH